MEYCYVVVKGRPDLIAELNQGLKILRATGQYDRIHAKWLGEKAHPPYLRYAAWIAAAAVALSLGLVAWNRALGRTVAARTRSLQESESRLRALLDHIPDWVWLKDTESKYVTANAPYAEALKRSMEALPGLSDADIWPEAEARQFVADDREVIRSGQPKRITERIVDAQGRARWFETVKAPVRNAEGGLLGTVGIARDVTERRRAEHEKETLRAQLLQSQKLDSIGRLAGGVAHDFNNMLEVILGYADLAMSEMEPEDPLRAQLLEIHKAALRSADLTRQLLAFARKQTAAPKVLDLNETVAGALKMLLRLIGEDIDLAWMPDADLWPVMIDPSQVDQILANVCVNARDAIGGVGKVTIETQNIVLDEADCADRADAAPGEYAMLAVSDDGCGMSKDVLGHIFEPFYTTKGFGHGVGLGLATVYGIVRQNNGFINVYSEVGKGTTLKIYLPRYAGEIANAGEARLGEPPRGNGETVLLVEDEEAILSIGQTMLQRLGYAVLTADTPSKAIRESKTHAGQIHLLITDVIMPEMNGRELAERIRAVKPSLKCLFMSGYTPEAIARRGVLNEGVRFIAKPFSLRDLALKIREALDED